MIITNEIHYHDDDQLLSGYYANNVSESQLMQKKPAILIAPDWSGRNAFACQVAEKLAERGYIGFALDMYGNGKVGQTKEEKMNLMQPFMNDRNKLAKRMLAAFEAIKSIEEVDQQRIGVIGYCFGGLCALDLARTGVNLAGAASFHGFLNAPPVLDALSQSHATITAKILILHGFDDPMVPPIEITHFADEMRSKNVDWQMEIYGNTLHAFTNPEANDPQFGTVYSANADKRSWQTMTTFFHSVFNLNAT